MYAFRRFDQILFKQAHAAVKSYLQFGQGRASFLPVPSIICCATVKRPSAYDKRDLLPITEPMPLLQSCTRSALFQ